MCRHSLNPLKRVNSILTCTLLYSLHRAIYSLNPLKRVNSILTNRTVSWKTNWSWVSIPSNGSIQFLLDLVNLQIEMSCLVSIPSNGSIQFLLIIIRGCLDISLKSLNPLKRVNSILTLYFRHKVFSTKAMSQSPQTGQFNSYKSMGTLQ